MRRVLVWSNDPVGARMAGPGIRYLNFARALTSVASVTLAAPEPPDAEGEFEVRSTLELRRLSGRELARSFEVIVAQSLSPGFALRASKAGVGLVLDLYAPSLIEGLAYMAGQPGGSRERQLRYDELRAVQLAGLRLGDAFLCASDRQRDLWLGVLGALGRLTVSGWERDAAFRSLVVVPFGLDDELPAAAEPALRGVLPGIEASDFVLVWGGGIWNWFDPLTVIDAVARLSSERGDVKLVFLGTRHPSAAVERMTMTERALARAEELGVEGGHVFFNQGWVPYSERHRYLLDADLGVSAHLDTLETRFAFRTRLLDYLWARLPIVCTGGDELGERVRAHRAGRVLAAGAVDAWCDAIRQLADDRLERQAIGQRLERLRAEYTWPRVCEPLVRVVTELPDPAGVAKPSRGAVAKPTFAGIRASLAVRGVGGTANAAVRALGRAVGRSS